MSDLVVGLLAEDFISALGLTTDARQIVLSRKSQQHILKRRQVASTADAALAAHRISEALATIRFELLPRMRPHVVNLVGYVGSQQRYLKVVLKFIPGSKSHSSKDECWVSNAIPVGKRRMRKERARHRLRPL